MPFLGILLRVGKQTEVLPGKLMPKVGWFGSGSRFTFATAKMGLRRFVHFRVGRRRRRMVEMDKMGLFQRRKWKARMVEMESGRS